MIDASDKEALLVLKKWRESSALLRIMLHNSSGILNAVGVLGGIEKFLELGDAGTWSYSTLVEGATFKFGTSEEARGVARAGSLEKYESLLEITFASGERMALLEIIESQR